MTAQVTDQNNNRTCLRAISWGVISALAGIAMLMMLIAAWITVRGDYPQGASHLTVPLDGLNPVAGEFEENESGVRLVPDKRGMIVVLFDQALRFPAFQFSRIRFEFAGSPAVRGARVLWATRQEPGKTHSHSLDQDRQELTADLASSGGWSDQIIGIGFTAMSQEPLELVSARLFPREPGIGNVLERMFEEWAYIEGYRGYTINRLEGAGDAKLVPISLVGGLVLMIVGSVWMCITARPKWRTLRKPVLISVAATIWLFMTLPWVLQVWVEAVWSVETYGGKTEAERRIGQSDGELFELAQAVKEVLPPTAERIFVVGSGRRSPGSVNYKRAKLHYYLAPYNVFSIRRFLPRIGKGFVFPGDYVLVLDPNHRSYELRQGRIHPGYRARMMLEYQGTRLYEVLGSD